MDEDQNNPSKPPDSPESDPFPGLRPGGRPRGGVQPHEKKLLFRLIPIGLAVAALYAVPKPTWWSGWITGVATVVLFAAGVTLVARALSDR